jgi:hypothetical protein
VPQPLRKLHAELNLPEAQDQARLAIRRVIEICVDRSKFVELLNERLAAAGQKTITRQATQWWESEGTFLHEQFWPHIEALTDFRVTRVHLAPQVYGIGAWRIDQPYAP